MRLRMFVVLSLLFPVLLQPQDVVAEVDPAQDVEDYQAQMQSTFSKQEIFNRWKVYAPLAMVHRDRPFFMPIVSGSEKQVVVELEGLKLIYTFKKKTDVKEWDGTADGLYHIAYEDRDMRIEETHIYAEPIRANNVIVWDGPKTLFLTGLRKKETP